MKNKLQELKKIALNRMEGAKEYIFERAAIAESKEVKELTEEEKYDLLDIDMDHGPVVTYDREDMENHNFDMGVYTAWENVLEEIEKLENNET